MKYFLDYIGAGEPAQVGVAMGLNNLGLKSFGGNICFLVPRKNMISRYCMLWNAANLKKRKDPVNILLFVENLFTKQ